MLILREMKRRWTGLLCAILLIGVNPLSAQKKLLDGFEELSGWQVIVSEGVTAGIESVPGREGRAMALSYAFHGGAGYAIVQKRFPLVMPANYKFSFYLRGEGPNNNFEFKLLDASGNVYWIKQLNVAFPESWQKKSIRKRHIRFAWGPAGGGEIEKVDRIEFVVSAGNGGTGKLFIDEFTFEALPAEPPSLSSPAVVSQPESDENPHLLMDGDPQTVWHSRPEPERQRLLIDLKTTAEYGGLVIDWDDEDYAVRYNVLAADDTSNWQPVYRISRGRGGRRYIYLENAESRYLALDLLESSRSRGYAIREIHLQGVDFSETPEALFRQIARDKPRGFFPRYLYNEQSYWTVAGVSGDAREALVNEDGMVEVDKGSFSIEPFLFVNRHLITWNDVRSRQSLDKEYLPIPSVVWEYDSLQMHLTAFAAGMPGRSRLYLIYRLSNFGTTEKEGSLFLAIRPFQVNPPWQFLNWPGGTTRIHAIHLREDEISINETRRLWPFSKVDGAGAAVFDAGDIVEYLAKDELPMETAVRDEFGFASGALRFRFKLAPGGQKSVYLVVPFYETTTRPHLSIDSINATWQETRAFWDAQVNRVTFKLPPSAHKLLNTVRSTLAYILINRDGTGIQPGSRNYERSWIRDGSLTSAALLRWGITDEVEEFIDWYAGFQYDSGKVPCVVDWRGADPVPEHDSHGQLIFAIRQYHRFTGDTTFLRRHLPHVKKAVAYLDYLRNQRRTAAYRAGNDSVRAHFGLLPESISHEGYSAKPMHSYWDDFFGLQGYKDATEIADILGEHALAKQFAASRDTFRHDLYASLRQAVAYKKLDYLPGSVELGDFDATSTAIAIYPCQELANLPQPYAQNTFDRYFDFFLHRLDPSSAWLNFTPYEIRLATAFILLGQPERAHRLLDYFLGYQRPSGWNHWAEVVWRDPRAPQFIGDMPHTWVGSEFLHAVRAMFVYENEAEQSLIIGAGLRSEWVESPDGIEVHNLPTYYGALSYAVRRRAGGFEISLSGSLHLPEGNIWLKNPGGQKPSRILINGENQPLPENDFIRVAVFPADIRIDD